jgi:parallel beta-helix repeat protein
VASGDRIATFQLKNGVAIKGGYAGGSESNPDVRDINLYKTILSGDLNGDDGPNFANHYENSYHVVTGSGTNETAVLDGFTITGGNANGPSPHDHGGGMFNNAGSPTVINCNFSKNSALQHGGGMDNSDSHPKLTNCTFIGNAVEFKYGGGIRNYNSTPTLINCIFVGNLGKSQGGGMFNHNHSNASLINCTFSANTAADSGGIGNALESNPTLTNCIIWGNLAIGEVDEFAQIRGGTPVINNCCIHGWSNMLGGTSNHGLDPLFVDADGVDNIPGTEDDNLHLLTSSPCINAGDNSAIPQSIITDLDGNPRIINGTVDMGVYESDVVTMANFRYVDAVNGNDNNDGLTLQAAFATIQKGIDASADGEVVLVYPGLYQEEINFLGKTLTVQGVAISPDGVPVLQNPGDFAVSFYYDEGPHSILKNFIITDSFMGVFIADSSPTLSNLTIVGNKYGIETYANSEPDISNTILWNNTDGDLFGCQARYSCIERGGEDNISDNPLFVDPENGDYHIRSERGRYWPEYDIWVLDQVTSPCVDGGDPDADTLNEPMPHGGRINIGAYGGTTEASLSPNVQQRSVSIKASNPYPIDGAVDVEGPLTFTWTAGINAVSHHIYYGSDKDAVENADTSEATGIYRGYQATTSYTPPEGIRLSSTPYYWRIDEIDYLGNTTKGNVWAFTTVPPPPPKGRTCFTAETGVWVNGTLVPISTSAVGQSICGINTLSNIEVVEKHIGTFTCYDVLFESNNCISIAENHYFLAETGKWIALQNLDKGTRLKTLKGSIAIINITKRPIPYVGNVYNLKIDSSDRYMVGKDAIVVRDY